MSNRDRGDYSRDEADTGAAATGDLGAAAGSGSREWVVSPTLMAPLRRRLTALAPGPSTSVLLAVFEMHGPHPKPAKSWDRLCATHVMPPGRPTLAHLEAIRSCPACGYRLLAMCRECTHLAWPCPTVRVIATGFGVPFHVPAGL